MKLWHWLASDGQRGQSVGNHQGLAEFIAAEAIPGPKGPIFTYSTPDMPLARRSLIRLVERLSGRVGFERLYRDWQGARHDPAETVFTTAVRKLGVRAEVSADEVAQIPATGPLLVVANHPFGIVDGLLIGHLVSTRRRDVKLICHSLLCQPPEARGILMPIDFGAGPDARRTSAETRRRAVEWLDQGHALIIFPAGGVATARAFGQHAADFVWHPFVARLAQRAGVQTVAMFVAGQNSRLFHVVSQWSYPLRVALIFHETRRRLRAPVRVRVALPVAMAGVAKAEVVAVLRRRTYAMSEVGLKAEDTYEFPAHIRF